MYWHKVGVVGEGLLRAVGELVTLHHHQLESRTSFSLQT